jgi:phosphate transport system permease protein
LWRWLFQTSTIAGIIALAALLYTIVVQSFGLVAVQDTMDPTGLAVNGVPLGQLSKEQLVAILSEHVSAGVMRRLESERPFAGRSRENVYALVVERVVEPDVVASWSLTDSLLRRRDILAEAAEQYPGARLEWRQSATGDLAVSDYNGS